MTIASEITRLQNDKAAICTAIENKGVTVGAVTLDSYASCIDAIPSGGKKTVEYMAIGGGGGGGGGQYTFFGGGGGAGGVNIGTFAFDGNICVCVGAGGAGGANIDNNNADAGCNGGDSSLNDTCNSSNVKIAFGGGGGGACNCSKTGMNGRGCCGGSGGGSVGFCLTYQCNRYLGGCPIYLGCGNMGNAGGSYQGNCGCCYGIMAAGGGGGAGGSGQGNIKSNAAANTTYAYMYASAGGIGLGGTWGGKSLCFAGGGGGAFNSASSCGYAGKGQYGGGNGGFCCSGYCNGTDATKCGSGGGGGFGCSSTYKGNGGKGAAGIVIIGYNCSCKDCNGFTCATGGNSCYVCNGMKYHCFTSNGTFTIVS